MGLDYERTPQTTAQDTGFQLSGYRRLGANGNAQYQFDRHTAVGGSFSAYQTRNDAGTAGGGQSRSLYGSAFYQTDRKSTRLNSSHSQISYAVFCLKKKKKVKQAVSIN